MNASETHERTIPPWLSVLLRFVVGIAVFLYLFISWFSFSHEDQIQPVVPDSPTTVLGPCAINLYGLPRQFQELVLPSLKRNVIQPNAKYNCDYFVHYYDRREESDYRGADRGRSGTIDPEQVKLLTQAVHEEHLNDPPSVVFEKETEESFFSRHDSLLETIHTKRGSDEKLLYIPLSEEKPFPNATIVNIIKMWHSQQAVWDLMMKSKKYSRVAMLRSDVLYVTPIDIYQLPDQNVDYENARTVVPNFSNFPVNDRMIYGPFDAVQIWAAGKFRRLAHHVEKVHNDLDGIHPERFLFRTIFPAIRDAGIPILPASSNLCFLRVRADGSVRIQDCGVECVHDHNVQVVEYLVQRPCSMNRTNPNVAILECNDNGKVETKDRHGPFLEHSWKPCRVA